jgi:hypothetical protein
MAEVPDWLYEKYTTPAAEVRAAPARERLPVKDRDPVLYREFLNIEMGDTYQERESLPASVRRSTRREPDPVLLRKMAASVGLQLGDAPVEGSPLTQPPVPAAKAPDVEGKRVFTDEARWEEIIAEAPEEASPVSFKQAFKHARASGMKEFVYEGDRFTTREKGESGTQWASFLESQKMETAFVEGFERERAVADLPPLIGAEKGLRLSERESSRRAHNVEAMKASAGTEPAPQAEVAERKIIIPVAKGKGIDLAEISSGMDPALEDARSMLAGVGITPEITSGRRHNDNWSLHEIGEAVDLRLN